LSRSMIVKYEVDDRLYFYIPTFQRYQSGTKKEAESVLPDPPELVGSKSGVSPDKVGAAESASASASVNEFESESESLRKDSLSISGSKKFSKYETAEAANQFHSNYQQAESLYQKITDQVCIPPDKAGEALETLQNILDHYQCDFENAVEAGKPVFAEWCSTRGKTGKYYNKTNVGWLSKWLERLAPTPEHSTVASYADRIRQDAEDARRRHGQQ
jgi:hypothetical protein